MNRYERTPRRAGTGRSAAARGLAAIAGLAGLLTGVLAGLGGCALTPGEVGSIVLSTAGRDRIVVTQDGPVLGIAAPSGQAFLGLPYAAPPLGDRRWRAPQPVARWTRPRPALRLGDGCLQNLSPDAQTGRKGAGLIVGSEDCLTLNVYAPAAAQPGDRRPVMVWVHGGAFMLGSGGQYDPSVLAERTGTLVVTFNYRLGALGFLALPELRSETGDGAFALLDQQAALTWVKANIAAFGGDPQAVTLFGQSAGAWSICDQMAAPGAAGLFARAILQSGSCTAPGSALPIEAAEAGGRRFALDLGCSGAEVLACLRHKSGRDILRALPQRDGVIGPNSWAPAYGLAVLPLEPRAAFDSGRFAAVPAIVGTTHEEGRLFSFVQGLRGELVTARDYEANVAHLFGDRAARILAEYPAARFASPGLAYSAVLTDSLFACSARTLDRLLAARAPVHAYEFDDPDAAFRLPRLPWSEPLESFHTAEIAYVFDTPWALADPADFSEPQRRLSQVLQGYWGHFARSGDPNGPGLPAWEAFRPEAPVVQTLRPDAVAAAADLADAHHCAFWAELGY